MWMQGLRNGAPSAQRLRLPTGGEGAHVRWGPVSEWVSAHRAGRETTRHKNQVNLTVNSDKHDTELHWVWDGQET